MKKTVILTVAIVMIALLAACGNNTTHQSPANSDNNQMDHSAMDHSDMNHSGSGEVPAGLEEAKNPTYKVGSQAILKTDHIPGMQGATATIVGAYDTTAYVVSYTPTTGGKRVTDHRWVIQQEIKDSGGQSLEPGVQVTLEADHMAGMKGAAAEIVSAEPMTVYMVDYTPTTGGEKVTNHQWVTESELSEK